MFHSDYRYTVCLLRTDGTPLGEVPVDVDWEPAVQWAHLLGVRQGTLSPMAVPTATTIHPKWHRPGEPVVEGLLVVATQPGGREARHEVPTCYFEPLAREASNELVKKGLLQDGELFRYLVGAYPSEARRQDAGAGAGIEEVTAAMSLKPSNLPDLARMSVRYAAADQDGDMPVFIRQEVLDETAALARKAGALETGGILIGHLRHDAAMPELFLEVTAQIPARHSRGELMRLTFTPATWADVSASIRLRKQGEIMLGWWHSHSYLKQPAAKQAEAAKPRTATGDGAFLSAEDLSLHRTCFPRAYSIAMVVAEGRCTGLTWALFGWNAGIIRARSFQVLPPEQWPGNEAVLAATGEAINER